MAEIKMTKEPPRTPTQITNTRWFVLGLSLTNWLCGPDGAWITNSGFAGTGESIVGSNKGEGDGVRKIFGGEANGEDIEDSIGDGEGEFDDGDDENGESEGDANGEEGR